MGKFLVEISKAEGLGGNRYATIVVGSSTAGYSEDEVDFLCSGSNDQDEISAAIAALPERGGKVLLLDGEYSISGEMAIEKSNVTLQGMGASTVLVMEADADRVFYANGVEKCVIRDMAFRADTRHGTAIRLEETSGCTVSAVEIQNAATGVSMAGAVGAYIVNNSFTGIGVGVQMSESQGSTLAQNRIVGAGGALGIHLNMNCSNNIITGNSATNCQMGVFVYYGSNNSIAGNYLCGNTALGMQIQAGSNNAVTGNICCDNSAIGIQANTHLSAIFGNVCNNNNERGISGVNSNNAVTGNVCRENVDKGIQISQSGNTIVGNNCGGEGQILDGGANNLVESNQ